MSGTTGRRVVARSERRSEPTATAALVARAREGDERAFRELLGAYQDAFYALARRYVGSHEDADDVLQEGFVKIHRHLASLDRPEAFYPWARRILANTALDHIRHARRGAEVEEGALERPDVARVESAFAPPDRRVEEREFFRRLERALRSLPPRQREVVVLHDVEGFSTEEVAERCGCPRATVRSNLFYGREKLRRLLVDLHE